MLKARVRQRKTLDPCPRCRLHRLRCICAHIPRFDLPTRVTLVIHAKELKRTTNTGRLAIEALVNAQMVVRGDGQKPVDLREALQPDYDTFLLYPAEGAEDLGSVMWRRKGGDHKPIHLIVPDGNWRQASKVHSRHPELSGVPKVSISRGAGSPLPGLRREHFADGMATLEAIALALRLVGEVKAAEGLLQLYRWKVEATLNGRPTRASI